MGLADELGSGMRNTYKYTKMYSGGEPKFVEDSIFRITVPLNDISTTKVGPDSTASDFGTTEVNTEVSAEVKLADDILNTLLVFCSTPRTRKEMQEFCRIRSEKYFRENIIKPLLDKNMIKRTIPDKPNSSKQKYIDVL